MLHTVTLHVTAHLFFCCAVPSEVQERVKKEKDSIFAAIDALKAAGGKVCACGRGCGLNAVLGVVRVQLV